MLDGITAFDYIIATYFPPTLVSRPTISVTRSCFVRVTQELKNWTSFDYICISDVPYLRELKSKCRLNEFF